MLHAAHEGSSSAGGMYTTLCGEPPNKRILRIHSGERSPRGNAHDFLELIGSVPGDYTLLFMNQS